MVELFVFLALFACAAVIAAMMWFMMGGRRNGGSPPSAAADGEIALARDEPDHSRATQRGGAAGD